MAKDGTSGWGGPGARQGRPRKGKAESGYWAPSCSPWLSVGLIGTGTVRSRPRARF